MKKLSILNLILAILLVLNIFIFHSPVLGVILGLGFIGLSSYLLNHKNLLFGFLLFLCVVILPLTIIYYFYQLNDWIIAVYILLLGVFLFASGKKNSKFNFKNVLAAELRGTLRGTTRNKALAVLIYLILLILSYFILKTGSTLEPVRTPWHFVSKWFFVSYFIATAVLIYLIRQLKTAYALILSSLHLFFTFSVVNIIFPLGFGYDPFIHQATEKYILEHGSILPKPFYYLGQYSLVIFLTKIFQISHVIIDKNLVPALAAVLLPSTIYYTFKNIKIPASTLASIRRSGRQGGQEYKNKNFLFPYSLIPLFLFLFIPFTIFTFTTPQNLADLLVIIIAFLGLSHVVNSQQLTVNGLISLSLLSLCILFIHPIAGLAAVIFVLILWTQKCKVWPWLKKVFYMFLCFSVFSVFMLFSAITNFKVELTNNFNLTNLTNNLFRWSPDLFLNTNFVHLVKTIAYFFYTPVVLFIIIFLLSIVGIYFLKKKLLLTPYSLLLTFLILTINSLIIFSFLKFPFLIQYEQGDFSWRVFNLGVYFLIPLALLGVWQIFSVKLRSQSRKVAILIILLIAGIVTTSLYFSYPRHDTYYYTRGFNTSIHDFNAIQYLEEITDDDYVVLANQQIGAAALTTFGFRYFDNKYFFYSIPTGGELYQIYWQIVYEDAGRDEIKRASELTGAKIVYVYFPDYWFNLKKLAPNLMHEADETMILENGKVWVFKFVFS